MRSFSLVHVLVVVLVSACRTAGVREDPAPPHPAAQPDAAPVASQAATLPPADAGPSPPAKVTAFFPVLEGACPIARPYAVGATPALVIYRDAWLMKGDGAQALYRMGPPRYDRFSGTMMNEERIGDIGGVDETHAWIQLRQFTGRGEDRSEIFVRTPGWVALPTPHGGSGQFGLTHLITQPDGSLWVFGAHGMYLDIPGDDLTNPNANHDKYFAFSATGEPLKVNLPGPDMKGAMRMASGELVAAGITTTGKPVLRRWSPTKKVDDLVLANVASLTNDPPLAVGTTRAVLLAKQQRPAFYAYAGEKLEPSAVNAKVHDVASWLLTSADELMVASADGSLVIESKNGGLTEEKLPEPGRLAAEPSAPWLMGQSGAVYTRTDGAWRKLTLPDGPWIAETHPPSRIEWVKTMGAETWVGAVRTDAGFGRVKPGEIRVVYSSVARPRTAPLRCGAPFPAQTVAAYPPRADASCAVRVVVVASELEKEQKTEYPKLGAALKNDAALGESLTFVGFGSGENRLLGILAPTPEIAAELVKKLGRAASVPFAPEIVCGTPDEHRRLTFRVKTGEFSAAP